MGPLAVFAGPRRILVCLAAPAEFRAAWRALAAGAPPPESPWDPVPGMPPFALILTGVGKASAAGAVAHAARPEGFAAVICTGVAGALPGSSLAVGDVVLADRCAFGDEGVQDETGWIDLAARGFPPGPWAGAEAPTDPALHTILARALAPLSPRVGAIATVSTCSANDRLAGEHARRTGAIAEAMEGAAIAAACSRIGLPFAELRVISNHCGSRPDWDLDRALARLTQVLGLIA